MTTLDELIELTRELPEERQSEVRDFARFLAEQQRRPKQKCLRMPWAGASRELRGRYTSAELQHKALDWWVDAALDGCPSSGAMRRKVMGASAASQQAAGSPVQDGPNRSQPTGAGPEP